MYKTEQMQPLSPQELRRLQLIELELLLELDRICRKNGIRYTIIGGTLLGAVRHEGFIPWDDDADVGMLRSDYETFIKACDTELDQERFYFQERFQTEGYRWGYGKLRRMRTSFVRPASEDMPYEQGVYIDVMPLDYVPDSRMGQVLCNVAAFAFRKAAWAEMGRRTEKNPLFRCLYCLLAGIPFSAQNRAFKKFVVWLNRRPTQYLRCLAVPILTAKGHHGYWRYRANWLEQIIDYPFEGYQLCGIAAASLALERMYGEYMRPVKFPPISLSECTLLPLEEIQVCSRLKDIVEEG